MLTDEERKRIYEEEKARLEAQEELKRKPRNMSKGSSIGCMLLLGLAVLLVIICQLSPAPKSTPTGSSSSSGTPTSNEPALEVIAFHWGQTEGGGFVEAKGQVKNITGKSLANVTAVVTFDDKSEGFITSSDALIDYNPILPGQTSPFTVIETYNPAMRKAGVEFKFLMGGTIPAKHSEK